MATRGASTRKRQKIRTGAGRWRAGALAGLATIPLACGEEPPPPVAVAQPVKIMTVPDPAATDVFEFPGQISAILNAEPAFEVAGKIVDFPVDEAQVIEEGDVIARLDPRDFQSGVDRAQANARKAETDLERYTILFKKGVNPKSDLDRAERFHEVALAELAVAEKALEDAVLRAPFGGIVAKKLVEDFQNVVAKEAIVILQDDSTLQIEVAVPEADFASMTPGLSLEERTRLAQPRVALNSFPGRVFPAVIKEFSTTADPVTRTFSATFSFDPPDDITIRPGMTSKVVLGGGDTGGRRRNVSIPARAIVEEGGDAFVWKVDPQSLTVSRTRVELGEMTGDRIAIESGLSGGEQIAISGVHHLRDGMEVRRFEK